VASASCRGGRLGWSVVATGVARPVTGRAAVAIAAHIPAVRMGAAVEVRPLVER
jgi:hypothetical protein